MRHMYGLVYNPVSGGGKGEQLVRQAQEILTARGIDTRLYATSGAGDPATKAEQAVQDGCEALVCLGGDGTLSEVAGAVVAGQIPLYIVPSGTGNDFARMLHLPKDPMEALIGQLDGTPVRADCGKINGRCFINIAGSGFDVKVLEKTEKLKAVYPGEKAYRKALISILRNYSPMEAEISVDGGEFKKHLLTIVEIANGQYFGGGMQVAPGADLHDGAFDVILIPKLPKSSLIFLLPLFLFALHVRFGIAKQFRARRVTVRSRGMTVNIDGRLEKMDEAVFEIVPGALRLMQPDGPVRSTRKG